jgi:integrase
VTEDRVDCEWSRFEAFCTAYRVSPTVEVAPLYLTLCAELGADARAISRTVAALDTAAKRRGDPRWSTDEGIERWLRGFLKGTPYGRTSERAAPLYREQVVALAEACLMPTRQQRLQVAAVILANESGLPASALARLRWRDIRLLATSVQITPPDFERRGPRDTDTITLHATGSPACPVTALRFLRGTGSRFVLDGEGSSTTDRQRVGGYLAPLPQPSKGGYRRRKRLDHDALTALVEQLLAPGPQASRDLALITISHGAALRGKEAIGLTQGDIRLRDGHLKIEISGRREPVYLPGQPGTPACPVTAWTTWRTHLKDQNRVGVRQRAFLRVSGSKIWDRPLIPAGLNYATAQRVEQAQLTGDFVYTSLRVGAMRGWSRDGRRELLVARDAGLLSLSAVERHERRETLISHSVAGMVGL